MNPSIGVIKYSLHKQIRELYEKKDAVNSEVEKLEIQSQINAIYDKIENLCLIGDNWEYGLIRIPRKASRLLYKRPSSRGIPTLRTAARISYT